MHFVCSFHIKNMKTTGNFSSKLIMYKDEESNVSKVLKSSKGLEVMNNYKQSNSQKWYGIGATCKQTPFLNGSQGYTDQPLVDRLHIRTLIEHNVLMSPHRLGATKSSPAFYQLICLLFKNITSLSLSAIYTVGGD